MKSTTNVIKASDAIAAVPNGAECGQDCAIRVNHFAQLLSGESSLEFTNMALINAAAEGDVPYTRAMLRLGANATFDDYSALRLAARNGKVGVVRELLRSIDDPAAIEFALNISKTKGEWGMPDLSTVLPNRRNHGVR